jgi:hypothetical protein
VINHPATPHRPLSSPCAPQPDEVRDGQCFGSLRWVDLSRPNARAAKDGAELLAPL